jgi:hypothetical protein
MSRQTTQKQVSTTSVSADMADTPTRLSSRAMLWRVVAAAAVTRVVLAITAWLSTYAFKVQTSSFSLRYPRYAEAYQGFLGHLLNPWARWDGVWYIKIAHSGYASADGSTAFFPLYSVVLRYLSYVFDGNLVITGIIISLACYFAACVLLYKLVAIDFSPRVAYWSVMYISVFPTAFFFQAVYSESLFLLVSVACLYWARVGRWRLAGLAGLLATLTRSSGVLLFVPMAMLYYEQRDWQWRRTDAHVANLLVVPEGLLVWMAYLGLSFHQPWLFAEAQSVWKRGFALPTTALWHGVEAAVQGARQILSGQYVTVYWPVSRPADAYQVGFANLINLAALIIVALFLYYGARKLPRAYTVYGALALAFPLCFPAHYFPLYSMPRFALGAFPAFIAMAIWGERHPRAHIVVIALFALSMLVLTAKFAVFSWVS